MRATLTLVALALMLLQTGCAKKPASSPAYSSNDYDYASVEKVAAESTGRRTRSSPKRGAPAPPPPPPPAMAPMAPPMDEAYADDMAPEEPEPEEASAGRMVHYDGYTQIRTPRAEELVEEVIALAESVEGEVETRSLTRVTVRVPVEQFETIWEQILDMGPVVRRNLGAEDVTDAFTDLDLRLQSMRATRDRLNQLLLRTTELEERMALLQEIHRLTTDIEVAMAHLATLADLAAMSRITVEAVAPDLRANANHALPYGMEWIDGLAAFDHHMAYVGRPVRLTVPEGFVGLDPKRFHAQAADGAVAWAFNLKNDPKGSPAFWRESVMDRIGDQLSDGTTTQVGAWSMVRFVEPGAKEPYVWHLGFRVEGERLHVLQVTYPEQGQEERYHKAVVAVLGGGAS